MPYYQKKEDKHEKSSSVWEAALLKLRFSRRKRNPLPSLPRLRGVVVARFVVDA